MKRCCVAFFVLILALSMATMASAQENKLAFFGIDSDVNTADFQGGSSVSGIDGGDRVGMAIYVKNADQLRGFTVKFMWDATKGAMTSDSGPAIELDERTVNGVESTLTEDNALGSVSGLGEVDADGSYEITYSKLGGDALASTDYSLVYFLVLKADATFTTGDAFTITAEVTALNDQGIKKSLGSREFYVNGGVDVQTSSWGEIKSQFKD